MARSMVLASLLLVMLAGARAAPRQAAPKASPAAAAAPAADASPAASPGAASSGDAQLPDLASGDNPAGLSEVPAGIQEFDINAIQPLLPLLGQIPEPLLAEIALLLPRVNVTWVAKILPYLGQADPNEVGRLIEALVPAIADLDADTIARYIVIVGEINPDLIRALLPAIGKIDFSVLKKLLPAIAALNPDVVVSFANLAASIKPEAWEALIQIVELGVPAINLVGFKLNLLPVQVAPPPPYPRSASGQQGAQTTQAAAAASVQAQAGATSGKGGIFGLPSFLG